MAIEYVLIALEDGAVPFCHYDNPRFQAPTPARWMEPSLLKAILTFGEQNGIAPTFLLGAQRPPAALARLMDRVAHIKIVPQSLAAHYPDAMLVLFSGDSEDFANLTPNSARNVILRLARTDLPRLAGLFEALTGRFGRLSLHLTGIEYFTAADLDTYTAELAAVAAALKKLYAAGRRIEVNVLTDRMFLTTGRHCDAGEKHITIAPDGSCHICPAFLSEHAEPVGHFDAAVGFDIAPPSTVAFARAPLCTRCDAFQCKRCVWLNAKLTREYNVPSEQQCRIAHIEREASRLLLRDLGRLEPFGRLPRLVELNYDDPLELIGRDSPVLPASGDPML